MLTTMRRASQAANTSISTATIYNMVRVRKRKQESKKSRKGIIHTHYTLKIEEKERVSEWLSGEEEEEEEESQQM